MQKRGYQVLALVLVTTLFLSLTIVSAFSLNDFFSNVIHGITGNAINTKFSEKVNCSFENNPRIEKVSLAKGQSTTLGGLPIGIYTIDSQKVRLKVNSPGFTWYPYIYKDKPMILGNLAYLLDTIYKDKDGKLVANLSLAKIQTCTSSLKINSKSNYKCSGVDSCIISLSGTKQNITWRDSCDSTSQFTLLDGKAESLKFDCGPRKACTDSDGGLNYNEKGTTILGDSSYTDFCNGERTYFDKDGNIINECQGMNCYLNEHYCSSPQQIGQKSDIVCPNGCQNGVCLNEPLPPTCNFNGLCELGESNLTCQDDCPTPPSVECGNGIIEPGEDCDGTALPFQCADLGPFFNGTLSCTSDCRFNTSRCITVEPPPVSTWLCTDSDGGWNITKQGSVDNNRFWTDRCEQSTSSGWNVVSSCTGSGCRLFEYYCSSSSEIGYLGYNCTSGCSNGACIIDQTSRGYSWIHNPNNQELTCKELCAQQGTNVVVGKCYDKNLNKCTVRRGGLCVSNDENFKVIKDYSTACCCTGTDFGGCISDYGNSPFQAGTTNGFWRDECSGSIVKDYSCDVSGQASYLSDVLCPNGCSNGACINS